MIGDDERMPLFRMVARVTRRWNCLGWLTAVVAVVALAGTALYGPPQEWAREQSMESTIVASALPTLRALLRGSL